MDVGEVHANDDTQLHAVRFDCKGRDVVKAPDSRDLESHQRWDVRVPEHVLAHHMESECRDLEDSETGLDLDLAPLADEQHEVPPISKRQERKGTPLFEFGVTTKHAVCEMPFAWVHMPVGEFFTWELHVGGSAAFFKSYLRFI